MRHEIGSQLPKGFGHAGKSRDAGRHDQLASEDLAVVVKRQSKGSGTRLHPRDLSLIDLRHRAALEPPPVRDELIERNR